MIRLEDILAKVEKHHPGDNLDLIRRAYIFSAKEHKGQVRASGEPYLTHPLEVANLLAEMKMDAVTVSVGLLHDVVEDTLVSLDDVEKHLRSRMSPTSSTASPRSARSTSPPRKRNRLKTSARCCSR